MQQEEAKAHPSLESFFRDLGFNLITVSMQPELPNSVMPRGKYFSPKNRVRAFTFEDYFTSSTQKELQIAHTAGHAAYFLINEGNGVPKDPEQGNLNCGRRENITHLTTLAIDTDNADPELLMEKLAQLKLLPHYIVQSSNKKFHLYFLIEKEEAVGENILYWEALQKYLHSLVPGMDQSMSDTSQVLRIPGFYNLKYDPPFRVTISRRRDIPKYKLKELFDRLGASSFYDFKLNGHAGLNGSANGANGTGPASYKPFEFPAKKLSPGERRTTITRYIEHVMENVLPITAKEEDYFVLIDAFIIKYCTPKDAEEFISGKRRQNLISYFYDQRNYRLKSKFQQDHLAAQEKLEHAENISSKSLPDDFYLNFPGDLGMLVREIHAYTPTLSLELCFAGALMISGALKAESFRFKGAWPFVNGLVIAGTGAGKSTLKDIVERTLTIAGLRGKYPQVFGFQNSVQSLHTSLYSAGGAGTVIVDESGDYLETITAKNAPAYAKSLKKYFKESTTGKDRGTWLHPGGSLSYQVPPIDGGMLSLWMLIQPNKFEGSMSLDDMADGFLPRFFVFNGKTTINLTRFIRGEAGTKTFKPSTDLEVYLASFAALVPTVSVDSVLSDCEKELKEQMPKAKMDFIVAAKRDAVYRARSEARLINKIEVSIEASAARIVDEYLCERQQDALSCFALNGESAPALGVFVRMEEMLMRLLCNAVDSKAVVTYELAEACIQFHKFQTDRFITNEVSEMGKGEGEKDLEVVLAGFVKAFRDSGGEPVKVGEIIKAIKQNRRPKNAAALVKELVSRGQLVTVQQPNKRHPTQKITHYIAGDI